MEIAEYEPNEMRVHDRNLRDLRNTTDKVLATGRLDAVLDPLIRYDTNYVSIYSFI